MTTIKKTIRLAIRIIWQRWLSLSGCFRRGFNRFWFTWVESSTLDTVSIGDGCIFHAPVRVKAGAGNVMIGSRNVFGFPVSPGTGNGGLLIQPRHKDASVHIGSRCYFSNNVVLIANAQIVVGDRCRLGDHTCVFDSDFHAVDPTERASTAGLSAPVILEDQVWLGSRVCVLKGVTIGRGTVVGAMSVVTKSLPPYCIAAGNPARVIRMLPGRQAS